MSNLSVLLNGKIGNLFLNFEHNFKNDGITILYGPNGSGKTTIFSALGGFIKKDKIVAYTFPDRFVNKKGI